MTLGVVDIPFPVYNSSSNETDTILIKLCGVKPEYYPFVTDFLKVDLFIYLIIPVVMILTANTGIIIVLIKRARNTSIQRDKSKVASDNKITIMLVFVSLFFVITVGPLASIVTVLWRFFYSTFEEASAHYKDTVAYKVMLTLNLFNHSGNIFVYLLTGQIFRKEAKLFFKNLGTGCGKCINIYRGSSPSSSGPIEAP